MKLRWASCEESGVYRCRSGGADDGQADGGGGEAAARTVPCRRRPSHRRTVTPAPLPSFSLPPLPFNPRPPQPLTSNHVYTVYHHYYLDGTICVARNDSFQALRSYGTDHSGIIHTSRQEDQASAGGSKNGGGGALQDALSGGVGLPAPESRWVCLYRKTKAAREEAETVVGGLREATADRQFLAAEARRVQAALDAALLARSAKQDALRCAPRALFVARGTEKHSVIKNSHLSRSLFTEKQRY